MMFLSPGGICDPSLEGLYIQYETFGLNLLQSKTGETPWRHILNLGHGVLQGTPEDDVSVAVWNVCFHGYGKWHEFDVI